MAVRRGGDHAKSSRARNRRDPEQAGEPWTGTPAGAVAPHVAVPRARRHPAATGAAHLLRVPEHRRDDALGHRPDPAGAGGVALRGRSHPLAGDRRPRALLRQLRPWFSVQGRGWRRPARRLLARAAIRPARAARPLADRPSQDVVAGTEPPPLLARTSISRYACIWPIQARIGGAGWWYDGFQSFLADVTGNRARDLDRADRRLFVGGAVRADDGRGAAGVGRERVDGDHSRAAGR